MTAGTWSGTTTTTAAAATATTTITTAILTVLPLDMQVAWWSPAAPWIGTTLSGPLLHTLYIQQAEEMRDQRPGDREREAVRLVRRRGCCPKSELA